jgi:hypothetical protein
MPKVKDLAGQLLAVMETGEALDNQLAMVSKALHFTPLNAVQLRREIADEIIEVGHFYC